MSSLVCVVHWWGEKYGTEYVERLYRGVQRHLKEEHRFICVTDRSVKWWNGIEVEPLRDRELTNVKGCFARLRLWDPEWQKEAGIEPNDRIVSMDLDAIMTGPLDPLFTYPNKFMILTGANSANPNPYNGSLWMLRAGYRPDVWHDFSLEEAEKLPRHSFVDDQQWLYHKIPDEIGWKVGPQSGVYGFQKPGWPERSNDLPKDARMVVFFGWRDPSKFEHLDWVRKHWMARETVS